MDRSFFSLFANGYGAFGWVRKAMLAGMFAAGAANAETVTIAALGDSLVQGYGLPAEQGLVPQLQAWLDAQGADVRVINAGVSGDTTAGGLSRVGWTLSDDVDAMIVALGGNDFLRGIPPEVSRANLDGILKAAQDAGVDTMLVALEASSNYGPAFKEAFDGMYTDLADQYSAPLYAGFLNAVIESGVENPMTLMQSDGIHPNAQGVAVIVESFGPFVLNWINDD